ncbi:hypothetical protein FAGAP_6657 [Fusarium agapanthi]|uniref:Uncharacterized protein n=1 Tax=Fusarium agapanthi TaxID=1803897 RepID=A0A9P5EDS8_9HYPO|nr:hypothetical protein FAGAP_6657 [Fusarium agapanthi]
MGEASRANRDFQNLIEPPKTRFLDFQRKDRYEHRMLDIDGNDPIKVLSTYYKDEKVRQFIDNVAKLCTKPTFILVINQTVSTSGEPGNISPHAFILAFAVQILLFAPQDWKPDRIYTRDQGAYAHRFPTPETIGGGTTPAVAGLFSVEDLYRAVLLFYYFLKRRSTSKSPRRGHVFSIAAKPMLNFPEDEEFWADSEEVLVAGCFRFLRVVDSDFEKGTDRLEEKLSYTPVRLRGNCLLAFEHSMDFICHQLEHGYGYGDDGYHERNEQLRLGVEVRARGEVSAWSDDAESRAEEQDHGVEAEADGNEESDKVDETGSKRKAGDNDEGGVKKQKTSNA